MKTLTRYFRIIDVLMQRGELRLQDIADSLGFDKSTVYRFLHTAIGFGYVKKDEETTKYSLGYRFLDVASEIIRNLDLRKVAHPHLVDLERITGETIHLTIYDGNTVVYIDKVESDRPVRMYSKIGSVAPIHCTAVGKVILAFQPDPVIEQFLSRSVLKSFTPSTITDNLLLRKEFEKIKREGFATDKQEHESEICCIATPVWDSSRTVIAAISVSAVASRISLSQLLRFAPILKEKGLLISKLMGYMSEEPVCNHK